MALTPLTPLVTGHYPLSDASPALIKTPKDPRPLPHLLPSLSSSLLLSSALTPNSLHCGGSVVAVPPPHRRPGSGEWSPGRAALCPFRLHPRGEPPWPGAAARPSFGEPLPSATGGVHDGPMDRRPRRWSTSHGPRPWHFLLENNSKNKYSSHFSFRPLSLSEINPQSLIFSVRPEI
jgi:hypothetical protein